MKLKRISALALIFVIAFIGGCDDDQNIIDQTPEIIEEVDEPMPYPLFIGDVEIVSSPESVVCLSPSLSEIIFELDYGSRIIGRSTYCDYPPNILSLPDVGSSANPDIEKIIELSPSLLLVSTPLSGRDMFRMEQAGIATLTIPAASNLSGLRDIYRALGLVFEGMFTGAESGDQAFAVISKACDNIGVVNIGKFLYITDGLKAATGDTLESSIFSCFGENLAAGGTDYEFDMSLLSALSEDSAGQPDIILLSDKYTIDDLLASEYFRELDAVTQDRIIFIDNSCFERPSARLERLIEKMITDFRRL